MRRRAGGAPRPRGTGRPRRDRRAIRRGGEGIGGELNRVISDWPDARITPMFGRWGYFVGETLFACFPLQEKERDLWLRLSPADQARALRDARIRPHRRFARRGWIELDIEAPDDIGRALHWLGRAHATATRTVHPNEDREA